MRSLLDLHLAKSNRLPDSMLGPSPPCQRTCQCFLPSSYQTLIRAGIPFLTRREELFTMSKSDVVLTAPRTQRQIEPHTNAISVFLFTVPQSIILSCQPV